MSKCRQLAKIKNSSAYYIIHPYNLIHAVINNKETNLSKVIVILCPDKS